MSKHLSISDLKHIRSVLWDDWNFGSGSRKSFETMKQVEREIKHCQAENRQLGLNAEEIEIMIAKTIKESMERD